MLNVRLAYWLINVFVVSTWLQHRVFVPDKHVVHFPFPEEILNFLTFPFSIRVLPSISFRFLFLLNALIGCSCNNSMRFLLVWRMFQFLRTTAVRFGKNRMRFGSCCSWSFSCSRSSLTSSSTFSNCSSASFWSEPCFENLSFSTFTLLY